jgi:hypothetical protein
MQPLARTATQVGSSSTASEEDMADKVLLDTFGRLLVQNVRDEMIQWFDAATTHQRRDIYSRELAEHFQTLSPEARIAISELVPLLVDETISVFLQQFDLEERLRLEMQDTDGTYVNLLELTDGLEAEYRVVEGWAASFSTQRHDSIRPKADERFDRTTSTDREGI